MDPKLKMIFLDMDGTLTSVKSPWQFVHAHPEINLWDTLGTEYLENYLSGKWNYSTFCEADSKSWSNAKIPLKRVIELIQSIPFPSETKEFLKRLENSGLKIAIVSTGFIYTAETILKSVGMWEDTTLLATSGEPRHFVAANSLFEKDGDILPVLNVCMGDGKDGKKDWCMRIMEYYGVGPEECGSVGDSESDIPMFDVCRLYSKISGPAELLSIPWLFGQNS